VLTLLDLTPNKPTSTAANGTSSGNDGTIGIDMTRIDNAACQLLSHGIAIKTMVRILENGVDQLQLDTLLVCADFSTAVAAFHSIHSLTISFCANRLWLSE
jgi:hypothetical protein